MKTRILIPLILFGVIFFSSCGIIDFFRDPGWPGPIGARAFIKGRVVDESGKPVPYSKIRVYMDSSYSGKRFDYVWFYALTDSSGYFSGLAFGGMKEDAGLISGSYLGKLSVRFVIMDSSKQKYMRIIEPVDFEYDTLQPYAADWGTHYKYSEYIKDTAAAGKFIKSDLGNLVLREVYQWTESGASCLNIPDSAANKNPIKRPDALPH